MEELTRTIDAAVSSKDYASLYTVFSPNLANSYQQLGQGEQRALSAHFIRAVVNNDTFLPEAFGSSEIMHCMTIALSQLPTTVENAADSKLRMMLFEYKVNHEEDYSGAAKILAATRMDSSSPDSVYYKTPAEICDVWVKVAECFLEEDEIVEADAAVNKAGVVVETIADVEHHQPLILRYKSTYARVLDANRKFLQAATRYHDLSQSATELIDAEDLLQMLGRAATCAILAPSGPQRQRVLGLVYKDPRLSQLDSIPSFETHSTILEKMYKHQVLRPEELVKFEASLNDHQKATNRDGFTILERSVIEHNMIAVSKLYQSIYFSELARVLGVDPAKAERIAATMLKDSSLHGSIDQVEGLLEFDAEDTPQEAWDKSITSFCMELNKAAEEIKALE